MLSTVKKNAVSAKNHIHRNRAKYAAGATLIVMARLNYMAAKQWSDFMEEKGIDPMEFFNPEYFEELNS
jgi:LPS sulfotransferase NodH